MLTNTYDDRNRLTDLQHKKGATNLVDYDWTYDDADRITQFQLDHSTNTYDDTVDYTHDGRNHLTGATYTDTARTDETYAYDENGNRTSATNDDGTNSYTTGDHNLITDDGTYTYEYDDENNRTKRTDKTTSDYVTYEWDHRNRLTAVKHYNSSDVLQKTVFYEYDVYNRRITRELDSNGDSTIDEALRFVYDESGKTDSNGHGHLDDVVLVTTSIRCWPTKPSTPSAISSIKVIPAMNGPPTRNLPQKVRAAGR